jgi:tRNA G18 (ribose-2'-O)-methylase SpoU
MTSLENIRFVLVGTTHPGNIGAAARAMKTMGISNLHLVSPKIYPSAEATTRASGADDVRLSLCLRPQRPLETSACAGYESPAGGGAVGKI